MKHLTYLLRVLAIGVNHPISEREIVQLDATFVYPSNGDRHEWVRMLSKPYHKTRTPDPRRAVLLGQDMQ